MAKDDKLKKYEDVLMAALKFDEDDLAANIDGTLSQRQIAQMKRQRDNTLIIVGIIAFLALCFVLFTGLLTSFNGLLLAAFIAIVMTLVTLIAAVIANNINRDLADSVRVVEGRVELDTNPGQNATAFYVKMDDLKFTVKKEAFLTFKNGDPYRIYYAPQTKTILSAEWLRGDDPFEDHRDRKRDVDDVAPDDSDVMTPELQKKTRYQDGT